MALLLNSCFFVPRDQPNEPEHGQLEELLTCTVITMTNSNYSKQLSGFEPRRFGDYSSFNTVRNLGAEVARKVLQTHHIIVCNVYPA